MSDELRQRIDELERRVERLEEREQDRIEAMIDAGVGVTEEELARTGRVVVARAKA